jgi:thymidylate synthase
MLVINARNVNGALVQGIDMINTLGEKTNSRGGDTIEVPEPVSTVYQHPEERVILSPIRDANPFFHLLESIWILAGRKDVKFLTEFNKRMVDYSDNGEDFNAPYGYRLRHGTQTEIDHRYAVSDQLNSIVGMLRTNPESRQAVAQIWDEKDLNKSTLDKACNLTLVFRVRRKRLDLTVYNRSNDVVWGAYGANVVQFSMIQEYVAAKLNLPMGTYTQVSNSYHVYTEGAGGAVWDRLNTYKDTLVPSSSYDDIKNKIIMKNSEIQNIDSDIALLFKTYDEFNINEVGELLCWKSDYFKDLIVPMLSVYLVYKRSGPLVAIQYCTSIKADDWRSAATMWLCNRSEGVSK